MSSALVDNKNRILLSMSVAEESIDFTSSIETAIEHIELELYSLEETINSINELKPACDKLDYVLAASAGAICGVMDIFLVGKPGESPLGDVTDKWFAERTMDFAKLCGWDDKGDKPLSSAIRYLENKFKIPYDQRGVGDAASFVFGLNPSNHHFKSLAHNPSILGLFFSILDQFTNSSHFISDGELISLVEADDKFELRGNNVPSKLFCAFVNWFGHLISDMSGASGSKTRGMGIPSPLWTWTNDIIAIKRGLNISSSEFDKAVNELAINLYNQGYDTRFQATQVIPVLINEMLVRLIYAIRRLIKYFSEIEKEERSWKLMWKKCEPFSNPTVKRMLTVAHGTFCLLDVGEATVRGFATGAGAFNPTEFFLRLNIVGVGRFTISLYGEMKRGIHIYEVEQKVFFAEKGKLILENYLEGLRILSDIYDDEELVDFVNDFKKSDLYVEAFEKTVTLAEKRNVPENKILRDKAEIDLYFLGGKNE